MKKYMRNISVNSRLFLVVSLAVSALLAGTPAYAQTDKTAEIDRIFDWAKPGAPGCAVAVSQNGKLIVNRAYGSADLERGVQIQPDTIFDAGSVTKQFVAAAILLLAEEKRLSLSDDVRKHFPELPDYGQKITIDHLLTHTGGVRDWTGLLPLAGGNADVLPLILRQRALNFAPGEEWSYSNSGYVLLKEIVARTSGMPFGDFARRRLFEPLGMKSTAYRHNLREIVKNRALAYEKERDQWQMAVKFDNDRGGGGALLSTAADLLIWNDTLTNNRLGASVTAKLQEPATLNNGRKLGYARGLFLENYRGAKEVWHSGGAGGYQAWLGRYPEHDLSIAIMCNSGDGTNQTAFARRLFDLYVPAAVNQPSESDGPPPAVPDGIDVNSKTGLYFNEQTGDFIRLVVDRGRFRVAGGPGLVPVTNDRFRRWGAFVNFMSQDEFELRFLTPDEFELKSMEGETTRYRRAAAYAPTADDLKAFAGRYENEEIGTVFQIVSGKDGSLVMRFDNAPEKSLEIKPVDRDTFQIARMTVRFRRDNTGKVIGFDYSNPVVRNIKFTRLNDR